MIIRQKFPILILSFLLILFQVQSSSGTVSVGGNLFAQGKNRLSLTAGAGRAFQEDYFVLGLGWGYYISNGLEIGLDGEGWWGNDPNIYKLSPQVRYVFYQLEGIKPYVGAFYKRTFYEGLADLDSYGGRLGAFTRISSNVSFGFGYVFEKLVGCDDVIYSSCATDYPEISISAGF